MTSDRWLSLVSHNAESDETVSSQLPAGMDPRKWGCYSAEGDGEWWPMVVSVAEGSWTSLLTL